MRGIERYLRTVDQDPNDALVPPKVRGKQASPRKSVTETPAPSPNLFVPAKPVTASKPKPDHRPLLHNEDLAPSAVRWDIERHNWQAYEYLCHVGEAKQWMERVLHEQLPEEPQLPESLVDGVVLAKLVKEFRPDLVKRPIFVHRRLQYRHTENIALFMDLLQELRIPDLFTFDVTDLYEKRNLPKVIYCIHALSHFLSSEATPVSDLVGKLHFTESQINSTQRRLDAATSALPNFGAMTRHFSAQHAPAPAPAPLDEIEELAIDSAPPTPEPVFEEEHLSPEEIMLMELEELEPEIVLFQSICRGCLIRRRQTNEKNLITAEPLQALCRGWMLRKQLRDLKNSVDPIKLQVACRSWLVRRPRKENMNPIGIQAVCRGFLARKRLQKLREELKSRTISVTATQAAFRGVLVRFSLGCLYDDLDTEILSIVRLQAQLRGALSRRRFQNVTEQWSKATPQIIKLQAIWRARSQKTRYRAFMVDQNASLHSLRGFLHLLGDSERDYEQTLEVDDLRRQVAARMRENEHLESMISQLDTKIALLVRNKVALGSDFPVSLRNSLKDSGFDPRTLSKLSKERIDLYQSMFYVLQCQPQYLGRFLLSGPPTRLPQGQDTAALILTLFNGAKREEYYLMKLLGWVMSSSPGNTGMSVVTHRLLASLNRKTHKELRNILIPGVDRVRIVSHELESNPLAIARSLNLGSQFDTPESAIQDGRVRQQFVQNLQMIRELTSAFIRVLADAELPFHIRYLAQQAPLEALNIAVNTWVVPALAHDALGLVDAAVNGPVAGNLKVVARILAQIGIGSPFSITDPTEMYLQPLNEFVLSSSQRLNAALELQFEAPTFLEDYFSFTALDDLTSHERPVLRVSTTNVMAMHSLVFNELQTLSPDTADSVLRPIVDQLGPLPKDARDLLDIARFDTLTLELNTTYAASEGAGGSTSGSDNSSLFSTVKRCLAYMLRVQPGDTVMDVLIAPVEFEQEHAFNLMMQSETSREAGDLASLTFRELKLLTLEKILDLESSGRITREDGYQTLLNSLADDLRHKDELRQRRDRQISTTRTTLEGLIKKGEYLEMRHKTYKQHIEQAMATLQETHVQRRRSLIPFGSMNSGPSNGARYGSYRSTGDKLMARGVLLRLRGYTERQLRDVHVTISCNVVAKFTISAVYKSIQLPGGSAVVTLDDLLNKQYQSQPHVDLFGDAARFSTQHFIELIFRKFYGAAS